MFIPSLSQKIPEPAYLRPFHAILFNVLLNDNLEVLNVWAPDM